MATYVPNAEDTAEPVEGRTVESAALEFRTLKAFIGQFNDRIAAMEDAVSNIGEGGAPGFLYIQRASGNSVTTDFTLDMTPASGAAVDAYINGIYQQHNTFTVTGNLVQFDVAPVTGTDNIEFVINITTAVGTEGPPGVTPSFSIGSVTEGPGFIVTLTGTTENPVLNFTLVRGPQGLPGIDGATGRGITSIVRTAGTGAPGTTDTYTITYSDASTSTFFVYNGADGAGTGDMLKATYDSDNDGVVDAAESAPWSGITGKPATFAPDVHTHTASQISDSTATGRAVLTAADAAAARTAIGAGTGDVATTGDQSIAGVKTFTGRTVAKEVNIATFDAGNSGTTKTVAFSDGQKQKLTLTGNVTVTFTFSGPGEFLLMLTQDATGSRTVTWSGVSRYIGSATAPAINTAANSQTLVKVYYDGTNIWLGAAKVNA